MGNMILGIVVAVISGAFMSIQGVFNTSVTKQTGIWTASSFVQFTAFLVCLTAWFVSKNQSSFLKIGKVQPKYVLLGGVMGAVITYTVIQAMKMMGPAKAVMLIVASQMITAYVIELFGVFGQEKGEFSVRKLVGMFIFIVGIILFQWKG